ncbi:MAG: hypothetical protein WEC59_06500 [Salibacteraceae bacterium]
MKNLIFPTVFLLAISTCACSTCYECENEVELTDGNGNVIETTTNTEEFCTADSEEVVQRENEGAVCRVQ